MTLINNEIVTLAVASVGVAIVGYLIYRITAKRRKDHLTNDVSSVHVCNHLSDWVSNENKFLDVFREAKVIGLDCEWVTVNEIRKPVALLQLATADGFCVVIRLCNIPPWLLPSRLINFLDDIEITKVGVGVFEDAQKLQQDYGITVRGCLDLRWCVRGLEDFKRRSLSLQSLAEVLLGVTLKKNTSLSCSDWETASLSSKQIAYAAKDALVAAQIFQSLKQGFRNFHTKLNSELMDTPYKNNSQKDAPRYKTRISTPDKHPRLKQGIIVKRIIYDNCQLQAPDGEPLCSCDRKKAQWYVDRGRGEVVKENPFTVKLNFEPSGRPILDNKYYIQEKKNWCVVCGSTQYIFRKSVVPSEYRRYFPNIMKRNLSHDVVLLCVKCHRNSNILDQILRHQLAQECNAPIEDGQRSKSKSNKALAAVKSAAKALVKSKDKIPDSRRLELEKIIKQHFRVSELSSDLFLEACSLVVCTKNKDYVPHGWKVYQHVCMNGGLTQFERRWRQHFLDTMKPKFLPKMWSVDHNHERLALQITKTDVDFDIAILGLDIDIINEKKVQHDVGIE